MKKHFFILIILAWLGIMPLYSAESLEEMVPLLMTGSGLVVTSIAGIVYVKYFLDKEELQEELQKTSLFSRFQGTRVKKQVGDYIIEKQFTQRFFNGQRLTETDITVYKSDNRKKIDIQNLFDTLDKKKRPCGISACAGLLLAALGYIYM